MIEEQKITNTRGLKLSVILSTPQNIDKFPIILLLQGFLGKKDGVKLNSLSEKLVANGFATIRFDYAGYGKSEGDTQKEYLISKIINDVDFVLDYIKSLDKFDTSNIGFWGQSMGGMIAIIATSLHPEIKAICTVSSPSTITLNDDLEKKIVEWKKLGFLERFNSNGDLIKVTYKFVEDARNWNAQKSVKHIKSPKLFIVGTADKTVAPSITKGIFESATGTKKLLEISNMPHEYNEQLKFIEEINETSVDFFKKYLTKI